MKVTKIMQTDIVSIPSTTPIGIARTRMRDACIRHLIIIDDDHLVGILSDRDLNRTLFAGSVANAMTSQVFTITPETTIHDAARLMRDHRINCLPVVDGKRLVGIITTSDMLALIAGDQPTLTVVHRDPTDG